MLISRRGFLGSVIGTVVSIPFFARLLEEPAQWIPEVVANPDWTILFHEKGNNKVLRGPGVELIKANYESWEFISIPMKAYQPLIIDQVLLVDVKNGNQVIRKCNYDRDVNMYPGDTLQSTYTLDLYGVGTDDLARALKAIKDKHGYIPLTGDPL